MSKDRPSKFTPDKDSDPKHSILKKGKHNREHGEIKNLASQYKDADRQNREKFKEFQQRYAILKGKLPKAAKLSEETTEEVTTSTSQQSVTFQEVKEIHSISTIPSSTDEAGTVAKILRDRDECSQKTKVALEVLEEKKHQFIEYQNLVARVQKDYEKTDLSKLDIHKGSTEQTHPLIDEEKEALQKDIEDKSKVIRALQLKVDKLTQINEELKSKAEPPLDTADNSFYVSEIELKNERIRSLEEINAALINDKQTFEEENSLKEKEIDKLHGIIKACVDKVINIGVCLHLCNKDEIFDLDQLESKITSIEIELMKTTNKGKEIDVKLAPEIDSAIVSPVIKDSPNKGVKLSKSQQRGRNNKPKSPWAAVSTPKQDTVNTPKDTKTIKSEDTSTPTKVTELESLVSELNERIQENQNVVSEKNHEIEGFKKLLSEKEDELLHITTKYEEIRDELQRKVVIENEALQSSTLETTIEPENIPKTENILAEPASELVGSSDHESTEKINVDILEVNLEDSQKQVDTLSKQLDDANKNMIKTKAANKTKIKQMQKTIDSFSKMSDANSEVIRLNNEVAVLTQKVAELEEDKGNLQLHLVDYDSVKVPDQEAGQPIKDMHQIAETRLQAISELETQKFDLVQELHAANQKILRLEEKVEELMQVENDHVSSQMNSVQLEEDLEKFSIECKSLRDQLCELKIQNDKLNEILQSENVEKSELNRKLESYVHENMELTEKLEKLSAEKVSSAESIEIVESLTTQEKLEIERFNEGITHADTGVPIQSNDYFTPELNEDILKLSQDSVELHNKIELFTQERREVMEKMDILRNENLGLGKNIEDLLDIKLQLESELDALKTETIFLKETIAMLEVENNSIKTETEKVIRDKTNLEVKLADLTTEAIMIENSQSPVTQLQLHEQNISLVDSESQVEIINSETYDSNAKAVKKLTKEILKLKTLVKEKTRDTDSSAQLEAQLHSINEEINSIKLENVSIKEEKNNLNHQLATLAEINNKLSMENQILIDEKSLYVDTQKNNDRLEDQLKNKEKLINELQLSISQLDNAVTQVNFEVNTERLNLNQKSKEIEQMQVEITSLQENVHSRDQLVDNLQKKLHMIEEGKGSVLEKLKECEEELLSSNHALDDKENEINNLIKERDFYLKELSRLPIECNEKDEALAEIRLKCSTQLLEIEQLGRDVSDINQAKAKYEIEIITLKEDHENIVKNYNDISEKYSLLESKNKELLEKLKKFAFNLKKKHTTCTELEAKVTDLTAQLEHQNNINSEANKTLESLNNEVLRLSSKYSKVESEMQQTTFESNKTLEEENIKLQNVVVELQAKITGSKLEFDDIHSQITELHEENKTLKTQINDERKNIERLKIENEKINSLQQACQLSTSQQEHLSLRVEALENDIAVKKLEIEKLLDDSSQIQSAYDSFKFGQEAKLQERDLYIETLEGDISKYKDRIVKLEESISAMEERRFSLERNASQLGYQVEELLEKQKSVAEHAQYEDALEQRMAALIAHDEIIEKQLQESRSEIDELHRKIRNLLDVNQQQIEELRNFQHMSEKQRQEMSSIAAVEDEKQSLLVELEKVQAEMKKNTQNFEKIVKEKKEDFDNLESELQTEMNIIKSEKRTVYEEYEKSLELISYLKVQLEDSQQLHSYLKSEYDILLSNYAEAISFKESSDQFERKYVATCNEVVKLKTLLEEKELQLNNYKVTSQATAVKVVPSNREPPTGEAVSKIVSLSDYFSTQSEPSFDILDQIVSPEDVKTLKSNIPNIDFCTQLQKSRDPSPNSKDEVQEEIIVPKTAFACSSKDTTGESVEEIKEIDDFETNWGEDAHLEEQHYHVQSLAFQSSDDYKKLNKQIELFKTENDTLARELSEIKVKLNKALKKMKELKLSNENLEAKMQASRRNKSSELDMAIQDELLSQVKSLEETANAQQLQLDKNQAEKHSLNKQIDVLTTANERLVEMKEKMDCEIVVWKQKHRELTNRLSQFESFSGVKAISNIGISSASTKVQENRSEIEELHITIKELTADNEELQAMLEEMRFGKLEMEKQMARQTVHSESESDDIKVIRSQNEQYCNNIKSLENKLLELENHVRNAESINSELKKQFGDSEANRIATEASAKETKDRVDSVNLLNAEMSARLEVITSENEHLLQGLQKIENENRYLFEKLSVLQNDYQNLSQEKEQLEYSYNRGQSDDFSKLLQEKESVQSELLNVTEQYQYLLNNFNKINDDYSLLTNKNTEIETVHQAEKDKLLKNINNNSTELSEMSIKVKDYKEQYEKLSQRCFSLQSSENELLQKYNVALANNDKINKYNASLQEEYNKLEIEFKNTITKNQREAVDSEQKLKEESTAHHLEDENKQETERNELSQRLNEYEMLLNDKENRLKVTLIAIDDLNTNLSSKEREIEELRRQYSLLEKHLSDTVFEKDTEIAKMRIEAYDIKTHYDAEIEKLRKERDNIENSVESKVSEMRLALETQKMEIVTLKETLAAFEARSSVPITLGQEAKESVEMRTITASQENDPNKAELDFALYLLHQRSIKCEELTMELSSLLEERDTLQLRLSDALRLNESLRSRYSPAVVDSRVESTGDALTVSVAGTSEVDSSPSDKLRNKLSELKSVKHQRDIRLREDQEQRQRELELMQMDIANLPEEAATKLREAHYTLSRNSQSTSEVFLNWLMGKSTPKVVHDM